MKRIASFAAIAPFPCAPRAEADIATDATNFRGDLHKVPTATASVEIYGIKLKSRYGKLSELQAMVSVLDHLSVLTVDALDAMQCDSKEGSSVLISLRKNVPEAELKLIAKELSRWFEWATGDPKYIAVECPTECGATLTPSACATTSPQLHRPHEHEHRRHGLACRMRLLRVFSGSLFNFRGYSGYSVIARVSFRFFHNRHRITVKSTVSSGYQQHHQESTGNDRRTKD